MKIAVIGGGLSGLACATHLVKAEHSVTIFDKGRRVGGRLAARTAETDRGMVSFDYGAPYFTARDPGFLAQVNEWVREGVVSPWTPAGDDAWVGVPLMTAPALALAAFLDVRTSVRIEALHHDPSGWQLVIAGEIDGPFDALVLALPAEQARVMIAPWDKALEAAASVESEPCWTVIATFEDRIAIVEDVIKRRGILDWAGRNSAKPGRSGPETWVMHATAGWSRSHLEDPNESIGPHLIAALAGSATDDLPRIVFLKAHRWRYARSGRLGRPALWNSGLKVGLCGDWLLGPRVESAWLSGDHLAACICDEANYVGAERLSPA